MRKPCKKCGVETPRNTRGDCKVCQTKYAQSRRTLAAKAPDKPLTKTQRMAKWLYHNYTSHGIEITKYERDRAREFVKKQTHKSKAVATQDPDLDTILDGLI